MTKILLMAMVAVWAYFGILGANIAHSDIIIKFVPIMTKETLMADLTTLGSCAVTLKEMGNLNTHIADDMAEQRMKAFTEPKHWKSIRKSYTEFKDRVQKRYDNQLVGSKATLDYTSYCNALIKEHDDFGVAKKKNMTILE